MGHGDSFQNNCTYAAKPILIIIIEMNGMEFSVTIHQKDWVSELLLALSALYIPPKDLTYFTC